jgi:uncharacterized protein (UPF0276 family)
MDPFRPSVGLLVNPTTPEVMAKAGDLVEHLSVIPSRLLYDFGPASSTRFHHPADWLAMVRAMADGRPLNAHSFGLSLPGAVPLDGAMVEAIATVQTSLGGLCWLSEHLNIMAPCRGGEAHSDTAIPVPVNYDQEVLDLLAPKLQRLRTTLGCPILLENPATYTPIPEMEMSEPEFFNELHQRGLASMLLDLHNLLVCERNGGESVDSYLSRLDPSAVVEVHLAGGDEFNGFYTDSHSRLTPAEVWSMATEFLPRCDNLRAITFEYSESYFPELGINGLTQELEQMHQLSLACRRTASPNHRGHHVG